MNRLRDLIERVILASRYMLVLPFMALLVELGAIIVDFFAVLLGRHDAADLTAHTLRTLELLDITMIANLVWLIAAGSYYVFVDNRHDDGQHARPRGLTHVSAGILKEKMAGSLIGVSSVHLLQVFLRMTTTEAAVEWRAVWMMLAIHAAFIVGLLAFCYTNAAPHHNHDAEAPHA